MEKWSIWAEQFLFTSFLGLSLRPLAQADPPCLVYGAPLGRPDLVETLRQDSAIYNPRSRLSCGLQAAHGCSVGLAAKKPTPTGANISEI